MQIPDKTYKIQGTSTEMLFFEYFKHYIDWYQLGLRGGNTRLCSYLGTQNKKFHQSLKEIMQSQNKG